jgi:hypothetical protein
MLSVLSVLLVVLSAISPDFGPSEPDALSAGISTVTVVVDVDGASEDCTLRCPMEAGCANCAGCGAPVATADSTGRCALSQLPPRIEVATLNALVPGIYRPPPEHHPFV